MKILTPLQSVLVTAEKHFSPDEMHKLKKEFVQAFAEGFNTAQEKRPGRAAIKKAVLGSNTFRAIKDDQIEAWLKNG